MTSCFIHSLTHSLTHSYLLFYFTYSYPRLGDPVLGPTALDALEHGCALVQLKFPKPKVVKSVNPRLPWRTQHDAAEDLAGAPWVASTSLRDFPAAVKAALALQKAQPVVASHLPDAFTDVALLQRVKTWVESLAA